ncbi:MAG: hypothetical protein JJ858_07065 [Rhizobiaceae bacterium]|nr:hypothetical protein [Rhizobiaceae bacterium]
MKIFVGLVLLGFGGFIAFSFFTNSNSGDTNLDQLRQQAFISLFKDNADEGTQDFYFIGTHCMTVEADLDLPEYFTEHYNEVAAAPIIFSVENGIQSDDDPAYKTFLSNHAAKLAPQRADIEAQSVNEDEVMKEAMQKVAEFATGDQRGLYNCIGDRLIEEQSGSLSRSN